jgi:hypothetical protein
VSGSSEPPWLKNCVSVLEKALLELEIFYSVESLSSTILVVGKFLWLFPKILIASLKLLEMFFSLSVYFKLLETMLVCLPISEYSIDFF